MKKRLALALMVGSLLALGLAFGAKRPSAALAYPGADNINISTLCLANNRVEIQVNWQGYNFGTQWVDLSLYDNGFIPGTFIGNGPLAPWQNSLIWDGLLPGAWHYLRVNTLTLYGWYPSQTIQFFTPNNCFSYPPPCPYPGYPGCYPPPPVNYCPLITTMVIIPGAFSGAVCTDKPDYGTFNVGESITYCYSVSQPMQVRIVVLRPDGVQVPVVNGYDDGRGDCVTGVAGQPTGLRTVTMYGPSNQVLSTTHFYVQSYGPPPPNGCALIAIIGIAGCVTTNKADYGTFYVGESIQYCYSVSQAMQVRIVVFKPDGTQVPVVNGFDDGTGGCIAGVTGTPSGLRTVTMYGPSNQILGTTHFYVQ